MKAKSQAKIFKLENIRITSKKATKKPSHYRINYLDNWLRAGWFFLDSYLDFINGFLGLN